MFSIAEIRLGGNPSVTATVEKPDLPAISPRGAEV
jgi:hypothetical protein